MYLGVKWCDVCNLFSKGSAKNVFIYICIYIETEQNDQILTFVKAW